MIDVTDPARSRDLLETLGRATWSEALDWLYGEAMRRPVNGDSYPQARSRFYGDAGGPSVAPSGPSSWGDVLAEFRRRVAPATFNAQHPGSFSYFTPAPLVLSIAGETLAQWMNQGVDVFHAGPIGA